MAVTDFNPLDPAVLEDPYAFYAALHAEAPVWMPPGLPFALVSKWNLIQEIVHDTDTYSSRMPTGPAAMPPPSDDAELQALRDERVRNVDTLLSADPPVHSRYRSLVNKAFAARRVAGMEGYVRQIVTEMIDDFINDGRVELMSALADRLPMAVIADQIGVSRADLAAFKKRSDVAIGGIDSRIPPEREKEASLAFVELQRYFLGRCEERRQRPQDDMLTVLATSLVETEDAPRPLNDAEILSILNQFQVAGKETTAHMIGSATLKLAENPDQLALLKEDPALIPNMVEEALRIESPVRALFRTTKRAVTLAGVDLPAGTTLMLIFAAANRDEEQFPDAGAFDVRRENAKSHLAFSAGPHYCVGSALARLELRVAFEELIKRLDNIRLDEDYPQPPQHHPSYILRGLRELHIRFEPAAVAANEPAA